MGGKSGHGGGIYPPLNGGSGFLQRERALEGKQPATLLPEEGKARLFRTRFHVSAFKVGSPFWGEGLAMDTVRAWIGVVARVALASVE